MADQSGKLEQLDRITVELERIIESARAAQAIHAERYTLEELEWGMRFSAIAQLAQATLDEMRQTRSKS